ncbi:type IV secretion system DNA-binding domain-containing protein (plasmid) [Polymorphobacter sp. PAMC 29334]|uniref:type IV secretion system DNA-binding domain-containing protein n=1 Tax=Polymorphobacter sp. PAMC 29334 TaxID=2862331 RepID=UPI001C7885CD|nr:type IV secretion system DNA-binding domain-containing protein [Polymorphobacter sp. PAMC 29334]QYE37222.1 type IV secretion system DNA-binding domain-containing protein [Polymorphobacter sp. PAMC 29334]
MRGSFLDFTRGSQVAETVGMMFSTALRPMFWTIAGLLIMAIGYQLWTQTLHGDNYFWMMHSYASVWHYFEFNPSHLIGLKMAAGDVARVPISVINSYPPLIAAWERLTHALTTGTEFGLGFGIPISIIAAIALRRFGHDLTERKHTRGAMIASVSELKTEVGTLNSAASAADSRKIAADVFGKSAPLKLVKASNRAYVQALVHQPYSVAGVPYPWRAEQSHTMIVGTTGTGKSTAMKDLLRQIKARGDRAVVFDLTGTYVEGFYNKKTDVLLNPFDVRCPAWSPFADARTREHFKEVSQALIPMTESGDSFWQETARMLFVETCVRLVQQGRGNNKALAEVLMTSKLKDLHDHVAKTIAAPLTDPEAKRMAESIRATFNTYAQALLTLPDEGTVFSIRDWVLGIDLDGRNGGDDGLDILAGLGPNAVKNDAEATDETPHKPFIVDAVTGEIFDDKDADTVVASRRTQKVDYIPRKATLSPAEERRAEWRKENGSASENDSEEDGDSVANVSLASDEDIPETPPGSIMFVAAQHVNMTSVRVLLTMWITTAINTLMSMRGDQRDIRLWFLIDEIGALHNIPAIVAGMQTSRNYGGAFVLGVHTMAQLRETYGDNHAETISSLAKTKLLMNTRDRGTQDWESEQIGEGEWSELEENWSYGVDNVRDAATLQRKIKLEPLVLPTEFGELPDLHGYLKFPQGLPAAQVKLTYVKYRRQAPGFIERLIAPLALPGFGDEPEEPTVAVTKNEAARPSAKPDDQHHAPITIAAVAPPLQASETADESAAAPPLKPSDGGEGFQTAVASDPPQRLPTLTKLATLPTASTPTVLPMALANLDRLPASAAGNNQGAGGATATDPRATDKPDQGELARWRIEPKPRETTTVNLGVQELRASLVSRERAHEIHSVRPNEIALQRAYHAPAIAEAAHAAAQRIEADIADEIVGRGDDDELSR